MLDQSICPTCGALVVNTAPHSKWHTEQTVREAQYVTFADIGGRKVSLENGKVEVSA